MQHEDRQTSATYRTASASTTKLVDTSKVIPKRLFLIIVESYWSNALDLISTIEKTSQTGALFLKSCRTEAYISHIIPSGFKASQDRLRQKNPRGIPRPFIRRAQTLAHRKAPAMSGDLPTKDLGFSQPLTVNPFTPKFFFLKEDSASSRKLSPAR